MRRNLLFVTLLAWLFQIPTLAQPNPSAQVISLSFDEASRRLHGGNQSLRIADKGIDIARSERGKLNAFWYPSLRSSGAFVHLSERIEVKQPLSQFTDPAKDFVHSLIPDDQIISSILDQIGANTLVFPLAPRNLTTIDLNAEWVLFAGGKRLYASRIGNAMVGLARESRAQVDATQQVLLATHYYGLRLARQVVSVRQETYDALKLHYQNALRLKAVGMMDKAGSLFAQVGMDEALRELQAARKEEAVLQSSLRNLLGSPTNESTEAGLPADSHILPTSPLFINDTLPPKSEFLQAVEAGNATLSQLHLQEHIAGQQLNIDQSGYLPDIALFGKQTLYAHGIQRNLLPRTMVGVGFTWNLFDGLEREKRIRQSRLNRQALVLGKEKTRDDLALAVDKLYTQLEQAQDNARALGTTIELSKELVRMRQKAFSEGMATSDEVMDAQTLLSKVQVARLTAYYTYDVALMSLLAICGTPEQFSQYTPSNPNAQ